MHKDLEFAFQKAVEILKEDPRCKGGWHYGSISRGNEDIYSDYDPVFLVEDKHFEQFSADIPKVLAKGYRTDNNIPDPVRTMDTYWLHTKMLIKYFKRKDIFKLIKNIDVLFHSHVDLLLSQYDTLDWGAWESKVKYCVPEDKQQHLKSYFTRADFSDLEAAVKNCITLFRQDAKEICKIRAIDYPDTIAGQVISYFNRRMDSEDWEFAAEIISKKKL